MSDQQDSFYKKTLPPALLELAHMLQDPSQLSFREKDTLGIANGLSGIALLPLTLAGIFPSQDWFTVALSYFKEIARKTHAQPFASPGLYHGTSGVVFALSLLAEQDQRYHVLCQTVLAQLLKQVDGWNWSEQALLPGQRNFELIGGAAGIIRVLLLHAHEAAVQAALERLMNYLIWVSEDPKRWQHHPDLLGSIAKERYPHGYTDLGLAHGITGPLAVLSIARLQGYTLPGMQEAIERWSTWLIDHHLAMPWGRDWPSILPTQSYLHDCSPSRTAWCYGTPGIARTLWLAGQTLGREDMRVIAREALAAALRRPAQQRNIDDPQICHGVAGLLLVCLRFARDDAQACSPWLQEALSLLTTHLLPLWNEKRVQMEPGFLTGSVGGALTLIAVLTTQEARWDQVLLLS